MRLAGSVQITDYLENTLLQNYDSVVSLHSAHGEDFLSVVNPHLKPGVRYKISTENVLQISVGGLFRDNLTIVLREPPHELRIHNNTLVLERFETLLRQLCKRVDPSQDENPPDIPREIENIRDLPQNLTLLKLNNIKMDCLPPSLARLLNVVHLEVVNCNLIKIPVFIGDLPQLKVLVLAHNKLGAQENWDFLSRPHIRQNLVVLNLQDNELQNVPKQVVGLDLAFCLLDDNFLVTLPTALKEMDGLSVLTASNNMMRIFPYNLFPLHEFALDLSNNPFTSRYFVIPDRPQKYKVPSLKELAARTVVDYRLPVTTLPWCLIEYLQSVQFCAICSGGYFESSIACRYIPSFRVCIEVLPGNGHLHGPGFIINLCSRSCMQPELKFCEVLNHLTPEQYYDWIKEMF